MRPPTPTPVALRGPLLCAHRFEHAYTHLRQRDSCCCCSPGGKRAAPSIGAPCALVLTPAYSLLPDPESLWSAFFLVSLLATGTLTVDASGSMWPPSFPEGIFCRPGGRGWRWRSAHGQWIMGSVLPRHSSEVSSLLRGRDPSVATFRVLLSFLCLESSPVHFPCVCHDFSGWPVCGSLCCLDLWGCVFEQMWEFWRQFPSPVGLQDSARGISAVPWPSLRLLTLCLRVHGLLSVRRSDGTSLPVGRFRPVYPSSCWELIPELCVLLFPLLALCLLCSLRFLVLGVDSSETRTLPLVMRPKVSLKPSVQLGFPFGHTPTEGGGRLPRGPCWRCRKRGAPARAWSTGGEGTATSPWAVPRGGGVLRRVGAGVLGQLAMTR